MPAKMAPLEVTISALTLLDVVKPLLTGVQLSPLFVERNTPPPAMESPPAKTSLLALMARETMKGLVSPAFTATQLSPLSVERKMPLPHVAAKTSPLALIASAYT